MCDISIVIPVYNERESLTLLHEKIGAVIEKLDLSCEIIYVDDGSRDGSRAMLQAIQKADPRVVLAVQRRNFGKSLALATGFALAQGQILITMDSDLQDEPEEIPALLAKLDEGCDVVVGWRQSRSDRLSKRIISWIANKVTRLLTGLSIHDMNSGLKGYRRDCIQSLSLYGDMHRYIPIIAHFIGFQVTEIPVVHHKRQFGQSKYKMQRLVRGGLDLLTVLFLHQYSRRPLHLFGLLGGFILSIGVAINAVLTVEWIQGIRPIGNRPALFLGILLILIGVQLLSFGLLAELLVAFIQKSENPVNLTTIYQSERPESAKTPATVSEIAAPK